MMFSVSETAAWLKERDNFLILTHRRPDGDTLGCAGALAQGLQEQSKTAFVLFNPEITPRYMRFCENYWAPDGYEPDHVISVDTATLDLFPANSVKYCDSVSLSIDHHPSNTLFADHTCLEGSRASCGEIIYETLISMTGSVSPESAERLYAALSTDTGCFAYANTTADALRTAALLIEAGAPHRELNKLLFRTRTRGRVKAEAMIFSGLEFYFGGAVCISTITRGMLAEANADEDDMDDIASIPGSVEGVTAGVTIRELTDERNCKISVRTSPPVNAHEICNRLGGGGHPLAAGASLSLTVSEIKEKLLQVLVEFFPQERAD